MYYYVYILLSFEDQRFHKGYTQDLKNRVEQYNKRTVE